MSGDRNPAPVEVQVQPDAMGAEFLRALADCIEASIVDGIVDTDEETGSNVEPPSACRPVLIVGEVVDDLVVKDDHLRFRLRLPDGVLVHVEVVGDEARRVAGWFTPGDIAEVVGRPMSDGTVWASAVLPIPRPWWALP